MLQPSLETPGTYSPLNVLKPVAEDVWIVDGPLIWFGPGWLKMPFSTRMTLIRLASCELFLHSPTALTPPLREQIERVGTPRWIVGPNRLHYWWIPDWRATFPDAEVYLAPRIPEQVAGRIEGAFRTLAAAEGYPWDGQILTLPVAGRYMTEVDFFHCASRTLVVADLIENFESDRLRGRMMRLLTRVGGVRDPNGGMPRDMRLTFSRSELKAAVETMISWGPERIILAHGRWYDRHGTAELRRAFSWLLADS